MTLYIIAALVFVLDRLTKILVINSMFLGNSVKVLPDIFHITLVLNNGAAFGLFKDKNIFFLPVSLFVITLIILYARRRGSSMYFIMSSALGLILGGAAGNLADRLRYGHVIDFLDFRVWPVFNIADSAISIGVAILVLKVLLRKRGCKCHTTKPL